MKPAQLKTLFSQAIETREWMVRGIHDSRAKDYQNPFRKMVYSSEAEMNKVIGKLEDNGFILQEQKALQQFRKKVNGLIQEKIKQVS